VHIGHFMDHMLTRISVANDAASTLGQYSTWANNGRQFVEEIISRINFEPSSILETLKEPETSFRSTFGMGFVEAYQA
jgi:hypothetical protein